MKSILRLAIIVLPLLGGCPSILTDIRANGDGTYTMTRVKSGPKGEVFHCTPNGPTQMSCQSIDQL